MGTSEIPDARAGESLRVGHENGVTHLVLDRPDRRNALSSGLMRELLAALRSLPTPTGVVVIGGMGPAFSAGHDLGELAGCDEPFATELFRLCSELMLTLHEIPQPVIAQVHGVATAAGCQLVAACDLAVASDDATFATPGVKIGLFCSTPMVPLTRAVGRKRALHMLLTGDAIDAATARDWGLVNDVVPAADLASAVDDLAAKILQSSANVIGIGKRAFYDQIDLDEVAAYRLATPTMISNAVDADAQEGIDAFLGKRPPSWPRS